MLEHQISAFAAREAALAPSAVGRPSYACVQCMFLLLHSRYYPELACACMQKKRVYVGLLFHGLEVCTGPQGGTIKSITAECKPRGSCGSWPTIYLSIPWLLLPFSKPNFTGSQKIPTSPEAVPTCYGQRRPAEQGRDPRSRNDRHWWR